jgi:glucan phosphorylase
MPIINTNGVRTPPDHAKPTVYTVYLGPDWIKRHDSPALWLRIHDIPDEELWWTRMRLKYKLMYFIREQARQLWREEHRDPVQVLASGALLDPEALTIGFARRFATYKRATLLLQDLSAPNYSSRSLEARADYLRRKHILRMNQATSYPSSLRSRERVRSWWSDCLCRGL